MRFAEVFGGAASGRRRWHRGFDLGRGGPELNGEEPVQEREVDGGEWGEDPLVVHLGQEVGRRRDGQVAEGPERLDRGCEVVRRRRGRRRLGVWKCCDSFYELTDEVLGEEEAELEGRQREDESCQSGAGHGPFPAVLTLELVEELLHVCVPPGALFHPLEREFGAVMVFRVGRRSRAGQGLSGRGDAGFAGAFAVPDFSHL